MDGVVGLNFITELRRLGFGGTLFINSGVPTLPVSSAMTEIEIYGMNLSRIRVADIVAEAMEELAANMPPAEAIGYLEYARKRRMSSDNDAVWVLKDPPPQN